MTDGEMCPLSGAALEPGFVIHFDFISYADEGRQFVRFTADAGVFLDGGASGSAGRHAVRGLV
jgi:hypothetical protein